MADDVNYQAHWDNEATQCKNCKQFEMKDGKNACVPPDKNFESALEEYGEISPKGHCNYWQAK